MKQDCIAHEVYPVSTYTHLKTADTKIQRNTLLESIIFLNVGGLVNLLDFLSLQDTTTCYVLDSHRPINLYNMFSSSQIVVIDDGSLSDYDDLRRAFEEIQFGDYSDEEEESSDEEHESSQQPPSKLVKEDDEESEQEQSKEDDRDNDETDVEDEEESFQDRKRKSLTEDTMKKKLKRNNAKLNRSLVKDYYSKGSYYSTPITNSVYSLSSQLGKDCINFLWLNIISVSNNYIYGKLDLVEYTRMAADCKEEVDRLSATQQSFQSSTGNSREKNPDDYSINFIEDLQLMQLRHWNLYDSMYHSSYVATKLGIWKQKGRQNLVDLLVKMGFPHKESIESHVEMNNEMKMSLSSKMSEYCPRYNMRDIIFPSFERKYGFLSSVSCSDVVYAMTALLDCGTTFLDEKGLAEYEKILQTRPSEAFGTNTVDNEAGICCLSAGAELLTIPSRIATDLFTNLKHFETDERENWTRHFYLAYDAFENTQITKHGIILSIYFQKLMINQAISLLEKKLVQTLGNFQLTIIKNTGLEDEKVFGRSVPLLYRLMEFLMNAFHVTLVIKY